MKTLRSLFALLVTAALLLSFVGCGYSPVRSSKEEKATVITLDGGLEVPYEIYRFYFLSELSLAEIDPSMLGDAEKTALFAEIHGKALEEIAGVYAVLKLCNTYGIDIESREFDKYVKENVVAAITGDEKYVGYGDRKTYLAEIEKSYMNDSVFRFLLRYRYAEQKLGAYLRDNGILKSDEATVLAYMNSDDCVRVSWIYVPYTVSTSYSEERFATMEAEAKKANNVEFLAMTHKGLPDLYSDEELERGFVEFLSELKPEDIKAEYLLPKVIDGMIQKGTATVSVLTTNDRWFGVTYQEDKYAVIDSFKALHAAGVYTEPLYKK